ncbi:MAG TPA: helix-turn-helix domain-containing protein [Candidatus Paceibacterota bacterium]|nr:helix-turn-helix domain-containing protein [Candidatus Paceibacterota bacterium]
MNPEEVAFEQFFAERIKAKGFTLKKLADVTGIAPVHIESMLRGDFGNIPSAPYFRGYLIRLGKTLEFDGEAWWNRLRAGAQKSGDADSLPRNRFIRVSPPKYLWFVGAGVIVLIYLAFQFTRIIGKPSLAITFPPQNPYTTNQSTFLLAGTSHGADSITLNGDSVTISPDGSWQKGVLLQNGLNPFQIIAKKFLGGETDVTEQIWYQGPIGVPVGTSTTSTVPVHFNTSTPATGTFYE